MAIGILIPLLGRQRNRLRSVGDYWVVGRRVRFLELQEEAAKFGWEGAFMREIMQQTARNCQTARGGGVLNA